MPVKNIKGGRERKRKDKKIYVWGGGEERRVKQLNKEDFEQWEEKDTCLCIKAILP